MPLPTPDECRTKAAEELDQVMGSNPEWVRARSLRAIGWIRLADSIENRKED